MRLAAALAVIVPSLAVSTVSEIDVRERLQMVGFEPPEAR